MHSTNKSIKRHQGRINGARVCVFAMLTVTTVLTAITCGITLTAHAQQAPDGFVSLFNGRDLTGWKGLVGTPITRPQMSADQMAAEQAKANELASKNWVIDDGTLLYQGDGYDNLVTAEAYGDFELLMEWKIEPGADSGLYLRGTPQVQIWDGDQNAAGSGGLYNNQNHPSEPSENADKPAGEWNTFRIRMVGQQVSVWLNGKLVVDSVVLENYWDRNQAIYERGAIELQAHTTKVWFRNIYIKQL